METLVIWHVSDGRAGHDNQTLGLIDALQRRRSCRVHTLPVAAPATALGWWIGRRFPPGKDRPDPDLIIGAGRKTHPTLLAARRARGGLAVVLMRPELPYRWFDLCLVPAHDAPAERANIVRTQGALNRMRRSTQSDPARGLILIGGPSRHHAWDEGAIQERIKTLLQYSPSIHWTITDSPRTPASNSDKFGLLHGADYQSYRHCPPGWLRKTMSESGTIWVSEDSVSMIYESLTAGAATGVIPVPRRKAGDRIARAIDSLIERGYVYDFNDWLRGNFRAPVVEPLEEADRCADILLKQFLPADRRP